MEYGHFGAAALVMHLCCFLVPGGSASVPEDDQWWDGFGGTIVDSEVMAVGVHNGEVVIGGIFFSAGGVPGTKNIARWDGTSWLDLDGGLGATV